MNPTQNPEVTVLIDYANENLQLKLRVAALEAQVKELSEAKADNEAPNSTAG